MEKIKFEFLGLTLMEPNMLITNWVISVVSFYCVYRLHKYRQFLLVDDNYQLYFALNAISAFLGGLAHLFLVYGGTFFQAIAWVFTIASSYYLEKISLAYVTEKYRRTLQMLIRVKLFMLIITMLIVKSFYIIIIDKGLGMLLLVGTIHTIHFARTKNKGSLLILVAILLFACSAVFPALKISVHPAWFNYNDISHIFIALCLYIIYRGLLLLNDSPPEKMYQENQPYPGKSKQK